MPLWGCFLAVVMAGAIGGVVNAFLSHNGFLLPKRMNAGSSTIWCPGVLGNVLVGSVAAVVSWCLYGPVANLTVTSLAQTTEFKLSVLALSILIGVGGARWLSNEVDKKLLRTAGRRLARALKDPKTAKAVDSMMEQAAPGECVEQLVRRGL